MRTNLLALIMLVLIFSCKKSELGYAIINPNPIYENNDSYFPYDIFNSSEFEDRHVRIEKESNSITIENTYNDGYSGHRVLFKISPNLRIINAQFDKWYDFEPEGSKTEYVVEKVILELNKNPFIDTTITGHYNLQIREIFSVEKKLRDIGVRDTTVYYTFDGKFKVYSSEEIEKGKEWINDQNEIKLRIKDSLGVYYLLDKNPSFQLGDSALADILNQFGFKKNQVDGTYNDYVRLTFLVNDNGEVDLNSLQVYEKLVSQEEIDRLKNIKELWSNWDPGEYNGRKVKSKTTLLIKTKN